MEGKFRFLGTGASMGVPMIGCACAVCQSTHPRNKRLRTAGLLSYGQNNYLIDVGPDFREQALSAGLKSLRGALITHPHYDHIGGLDELRIFYFQKQAPTPCLLSPFSLEVIRKAYFYLFEQQNEKGSVTAKIDFRPFDHEHGSVDFEEITVRYFTYWQGDMPVTGFRFGNFAYLPDIATYPETIFTDLQGVKILVLSALRMEPSHIHFSVDQAVAFSRRVAPEKTWLVHMAHELDYEQTNAYLPPNIRLAYDGLTLDI